MKIYDWFTNIFPPLTWNSYFDSTEVGSDLDLVTIKNFNLREDEKLYRETVYRNFGLYALCKAIS